jgi:hypothetical protein
LSLDGERLEVHDKFVYKGHMLEDVPNVAWSIGYTNASWTLKADMTAQAVAKLLVYMRSHGYTHAIPDRQGKAVDSRPVVDLASGYVTRSLNELPKSGTERPWSVRQNYILDKGCEIAFDAKQSRGWPRVVLTQHRFTDRRSSSGANPSSLHHLTCTPGGYSLVWSTTCIQ